MHTQNHDVVYYYHITTALGLLFPLRFGFKRDVTCDPTAIFVIVKIIISSPSSCHAVLRSACPLSVGSERSSIITHRFWRVVKQTVGAQINICPLW
jgi:hypothetical protein